MAGTTCDVRTRSGNVDTRTRNVDTRTRVPENDQAGGNFPKSTSPQQTCTTPLRHRMIANDFLTNRLRPPTRKHRMTLKGNAASCEVQLSRDTSGMYDMF